MRVIRADVMSCIVSTLVMAGPGVLAIAHETHDTAQDQATAVTKPADTAKTNPLDLSNGQPANDFMAAMTGGTIKLNIRGRAEYADIRGTDPSQAYTVRTRLGYLTQEFEGFQAYVEMEDVSSFDDDRYNSTLNGQGGKSVIADPEVTELNEFWGSYLIPTDDIQLKFKGGRQVIALDDQRFIGHVGWRQDNQTFDAATMSSNLGIEGLDVQYSYLWKINRIFGDEADWDSDTHLINASVDLGNIGKLTGFGYLLDFEDDSPANSSQTYGIRLAGKAPLNDATSFIYQLSAAYQTDYADNPTSYDAAYYLADLGLSLKDVGVIGVGYEVLGSDDGAFAFRTPLATGHKFNGFADVFLVAPADGLHDLYVYFKPVNLPLDLKGMVAYHYFAGDDSIETYGSEINAVLSRKITENLTALVKYAYFTDSEPGFAERTRLTFDLTFAF